MQLVDSKLLLAQVVDKKQYGDAEIYSSFVRKASRFCLVFVAYAVHFAFYLMGLSIQG